MKEIKFKAWDKINKKMLSWEEIWDQDLVRDIFIYDGDYIPLQFTGLKDSEGNEIYEGDNVEVAEYKDYRKRKDTYTSWVQEVCFRHGGFYFVNKKCCKSCEEGFGVTLSVDEAVNTGISKIVGNIYEGLKIDL